MNLNTENGIVGAYSIFVVVATLILFFLPVPKVYERYLNGAYVIGTIAVGLYGRYLIKKL